MRTKTIKVCGNNNPVTIAELDELGLDYLGFIFFKDSPRLAHASLQPLIASLNTPTIGVFVNEILEIVLEMASQYKLYGIQCHGDESVDYLRALKNNGLMVIKVCKITSDFDWNSINLWESVADIILLDTATPKHGGSGHKFDWNRINQYKSTLPFWLAGGIATPDITSINKIQHLAFAGVDLNSRFEKSPGTKDIVLVCEFQKNFV